MEAKDKKAAKPLVSVPRAPAYILALDMSLLHTGFAHVKVSSGVLYSGVIEPDKLKGMDRIAYLRDELLRKLDLLKPPCLVLIEGYAWGARGNAMISLGELGGVTRLLLHDKGIPYIEISPGTLKKFVVGKGVAPKDVMLMEVFARWGEKYYDDNIADAFALAQLGLAVIGKPTKPLVAFQKQVVADILKTCKLEG